VTEAPSNAALFQWEMVVEHFHQRWIMEKLQNYPQSLPYFAMADTSWYLNVCVIWQDQHGIETGDGGLHCLPPLVKDGSFLALHNYVNDFFSVEQVIFKAHQ
jgi:hypothetical protein